MDVKKIIRSLQDQAQKHVVGTLRNIVEEQYCTKHGRFAEFQDISGSVLAGGADVRFSACCTALREKVQATLAAHFKQGTDGQS